MQRIVSGNNWWGKFLPTALMLIGMGLTTIAIAADLLVPGGLEGFGPRQVSLALSGLAVFLAGIIVVLPASQRRIGEWLLVGLATIAIAFAADLIVINGLPDYWAKSLVLISIGFGILSVGTFPATAADTPDGDSWLNLFSLDKIQISKFLSTSIQLGLLAMVVRLFHLENQAVYHNLMMLAFYGFLVHYLLPAHYRLPLFLFLSLAAIAGILGFENSLWVVGIGLGLIGICHLPISYNLRAAILLAVAVPLVAARAGWIQSARLDVIWPVLASMFMFRLIIYLYDLRHGKATPTLTSTLSYFFLLPNVVFPFFPVIDYSVFRRTYYNEDQYQIYQRGVQWMLRGVIQLLLYRYLNYYLMIGPENVTNTLDLVRFLIVNFSLYLRISGQFHLIIGILHLFGFNLPETHHLYFLSSSFTDLWRRINIYWKDFMMKLFFYPTYFRIRHLGPTTSLILATAFVFFLTWFLHAYQWFWLRGTFLFTAPDIVFWSILTVLVVANTLSENRRGRKRSLGQTSLSMGEITFLGLRTAGTFALLALLWSLWSSESIRDWIALLSVVEITVENIAVLILIFLMIAVVFSLTIWIGSVTDTKSESEVKQPGSFRSTVVTAGAIGLLFLLGNPLIHSRLGGKTQEIISDLTVNRLSEREAALLQRGYYEDLIGVNRFNSQLWEIYTKRPSDWVAFRDTEALQSTNDNFIVALAPSTTIDFNGTRLSTNRWGMRDRDYEVTPPPNTYRIALTGPSFVMGLGVNDGEDFEWLLEERLNREHSGDPYTGYEILNFAVPGYSAIQDLMLLEQTGLSFSPNALFFMAHQREEEAVVLYLADRVSVGAELPYPYLMEITQQAGIEPGMTKSEAERRLRPFGTQILAWTFQNIVKVSQDNDILPVWIFMPTLEDPVQEEEVAYLADLAEKAGFIVLDLSDAYNGQDLDSLVVAYWDKHPNAEGHRLIAEHLYHALRQNEQKIPMFR